LSATLRWNMAPQRPQLVLDGAGIDSEADLHRALTELLGLPEWYGQNLDALWDVLEDEDLRQVKGPVELLWREAGAFAHGHPDYFLKVQRLFAETHEVSLLVAF
jgi:RNAse (barnase) inhibitor barstar